MNTIPNMAIPRPEKKCCLMCRSLDNNRDCEKGEHEGHYQVDPYKFCCGNFERKTMESLDWITLTNKNDMKVSIRAKRIVLLTELSPDSPLREGGCVVLIECTDNIDVPVKESRDDVITMMNSMEMLMERNEHGIQKR